MEHDEKKLKIERIIKYCTIIASVIFSAIFFVIFVLLGLQIIHTKWLSFITPLGKNNTVDFGIAFVAAGVTALFSYLLYDVSLKATKIAKRAEQTARDSYLLTIHSNLLQAYPTRREAVKEKLELEKENYIYSLGYTDIIEKINSFEKNHPGPYQASKELKLFYQSLNEKYEEMKHQNKPHDELVREWHFNWITEKGFNARSYNAVWEDFNQAIQEYVDKSVETKQLPLMKLTEHLINYPDLNLTAEQEELVTKLDENYDDILIHIVMMGIKHENDHNIFIHENTVNEYNIAFLNNFSKSDFFSSPYKSETNPLIEIRYKELLNELALISKNYQKKNAAELLLEIKNLEVKINQLHEEIKRTINVVEKENEVNRLNDIIHDLEAKYKAEKAKQES